MKIKQKGLFVSISRITGILLGFYAIFSLFAVVIRGLMLLVQGEIEQVLIAAIFMVFVIGIGLMSRFWLALFPNIEVTDNGLKITIGFITEQISWQEIIGIIETKGLVKLKAILLRRRGMFLNRMYGLLWAGRWNQPVILVSPKADNLKILEDFISNSI
jgi:hypothetical protein